MQEKDVACQVEEVLRDCFCSSETTSSARDDLCIVYMCVMKISTFIFAVEITRKLETDHSCL